MAAPKPPTSSSEVVEVPVEKVARTPVVVPFKKASITETPTQTSAGAQVPTATTLLNSSATVEQSSTVTESARQSKTSETDVSKTVDTEIELQLETPKRYNGPTPRLQSKSSGISTPIVGVKTPNGKNVVDLTDDDDDTLSELRLNGVSNKSSRKSSRAPSPITASIKKSIVGKFFQLFIFLHL